MKGVPGQMKFHLILYNLHGRWPATTKIETLTISIFWTELHIKIWVLSQTFR
jgi:hypothetical protein